MKRLLIVWHTQLGGTGQMASAAVGGANSIEDVQIIVKRAHQTGVDDALAADAYLVGCSENFGGIAGMVKDFFERIYYPCEGKLEGRAWSAFVCAGTDGTGAMLGLDRIATGLRLRKVHAGVIHRSGEVARVQQVPPATLERCRALGATMAAGLSAGLW